MIRIPARGQVLAGALAVAMAAGAAARAQAPIPAGTTGAQAKELVSLLQSRKLESFAVTDPTKPGRYVAVLHVPGAQLIVVAADYERTGDMDYRFYHKDYMNVYLDLRTSLLSKDKVFIDDAGGDGLVAQPGKSPLQDAVTVGATQQTFNGDFSDPKKKNQKKISQDDYVKLFTDADTRYNRLLGLLLDGLKKVS